jgi:hypothetical protein
MKEQSDGALKNGFYSCRCPACRDLEPVWRQLAVEVAKDEILVGKVMCNCFYTCKE